MPLAIGALELCEELPASSSVCAPPWQEWLYVTTMEVGERDDRSGDFTRERPGWRLQNFVNHEKARAARLVEEEVTGAMAAYQPDGVALSTSLPYSLTCFFYQVIGLRLYTGPCYLHYNNVLRAHHVGEFVTTIHSINSGIIKLGKMQKPVPCSASQPHFNQAKATPAPTPAPVAT